MRPSSKLLIMFRPKDLRSDRVYGPMLRRALDLARQRRVTSGALVLDAVEDADQVVAQLDGDLTTAITPGESSSDREITVALLGTRADIDPARLVGPDGDLLWTAGANGAVHELVHEKDHDGTVNPSSLFELPNRTWVVASGPSRQRARDAFARPSHRKPPSFESDALATLRIDGPSLVEHVSLIGPAGPMASLGGGLLAVTVDALGATGASPGETPGSSSSAPRRDIRARAAYVSPDAARGAATAMREMSRALGRAKPPGLGWLGDAKIEVTGATVVLTVPVPTDILSSILRAGWSAGAGASRRQLPGAENIVTAGSL